MSPPPGAMPGRGAWGWPGLYPWGLVTMHSFHSVGSPPARISVWNTVLWFRALVWDVAMEPGLYLLLQCQTAHFYCTMARQSNSVDFDPSFTLSRTFLPLSLAGHAVSDFISCCSEADIRLGYITGLCMLNGLKGRVRVLGENCVLLSVVVGYIILFHVVKWLEIYFFMPL